MFPGHNYLGPGNPTNNGQPVDSDDRIAQLHDLAYDNARTFEDIYQADKQAIKDFTYDALTNLNPHSAIGAIGLVPKVIQQTLTGNFPKVVELFEHRWEKWRNFLNSPKLFNKFLNE